MPELPEVETLRRSLSPVCQKTISKISFSKLAPIETTTPAAIIRVLTGATITQLDRWGKYLLIRTDRQNALVVHLGMTGQLRLVKSPHPPFFKGGKKEIPHIHMEIIFQDGDLLRYRDTRRFGTISLAQTEDGLDNRFLQRLGPDCLKPDLNVKEYIERCRRHPGLDLKAVTLNQGIAAGLGNIYACEALYRAQLSPKRRVQRLKDAELARLFVAMRETLQLGIQHGGTTLRDYLDGLGNRGKMKDFLLVYDREGLPTLDGRGLVRRITQGNRSTWYCPDVQK